MAGAKHAQRCQRRADRAIARPLADPNVPTVPCTLPCLQVSDFLQRVKSRRFPPIEKDMRMVLAHCGSLLLDPAALQEVSSHTW